MRAVVVTTLMCIFVSGLVHAQAKVTVAADPWCPHTCEKGAMPGLLIELLEAALKPSGKSLDYQVIPWARALQMVQSGAVTTIAGATAGDGEGVYLVPTPFVAENCLFSRDSESWKYDNVNDLKGKVLGAINTYVYEVPEIDEYIKKYNKDPKKVQLTNGDQALAQNIKKLKNSRIDAFIEERGVFWHLPAGDRVGIKELKCLSSMQLYIGVSQKAPDGQALASTLEAKFKELGKNDKWLKEIKKRYGSR